MKRLLSAMMLAVVSLAAHAQSAQPLKYVPMVNNFAGGATATTLCSGATDAIGDGCPATQASLSIPTTGDADAQGNIYFADAYNNVIRRIDAKTGIITLVAGEYYANGSTPVPSVCSSKTDAIGDGCMATEATFNQPRCIRFDRNGDMVIADVGNQVIRRVDHETGIITTILGVVGTAGRVAPSNTTPMAPLSTKLDNPYIFMFDPAGNMIVTNSTGDNTLIVKAINGVIDPNNSQVFSLAGTAAAGVDGAANGNGGPAVSATFLTSRGLAIDSAENVYIGDYGDEQVRLVTSAGANGSFTADSLNAAKVTAVVGTGTLGNTGNGGPGTAAETAAPQGLGFDNAGTLYFEQYGNGYDYIRTLNTFTDIVNAFAGAGPAAGTGDNGPAAVADFYTPTALKVNLGGRLTIFDSSNNRIRNIYPTPFFSATVTGSNASQNAIMQANSATTITNAAVANTTEFSLGTLSGCSVGASLAANSYCTIPLTFTPAGPGLRGSSLLVTDASGNNYIDPVVGIGLAPAAAFYGAPIATVAGNGTAGNAGNGVAAGGALVNAPAGGAFDVLGNYYFADAGNNQVREISKSTGNIMLVAGVGSSGWSGDGAVATAAQLNAPHGVAVDAAGNVYIADSGNNRIRMVSATTGNISTIAGTATAAYSGDNGLAAAASLNNPTGIALDNGGVLYVADTGNNVLRAFVPNGVMVTLAGNGTAGYQGDAGVPQLAELNAPSGVAVDLSGNIFIADTGNAVVRKLTPINGGIINFQGTLSTYAGYAGGSANTGDGGAAISAGLLTPTGVGADAAGNLYIAAGNQVRMVSASGIITTIAGLSTPGSTYSGEGGSALAAIIPGSAQALAVDPVGNVYLSATGANRILSIMGSSAGTIAFGKVAVGATSPEQTVTLYNSGNESLSYSGFTASANFAISNLLSTACSSSGTLAPGASCTVSATFTPAGAGSSTGAITFTDNTLNQSTTQTIPLSGIGATDLNVTSINLSLSSAAPTYGQTITVTAKLTATTSSGATVVPTGTLNFITNAGVPVAETLDANGQATLTLTPPAGTETITVNYLGDGTNAGGTVTTKFNVAPVVLTITATSQMIYTDQAIPALTYTITGFIGVDTLANATTGSPAISTTATSASPAGTYPITVSAGTLVAPNYSFHFVSGTLTVSNPIFTLTTSPSSLTIAAGSSAFTTITVTPTHSYTGTVTLSCGSLPANVVCTFTSPTLTVNSDGGAPSTLLTIATNNHTEIAGLNTKEGAGGAAVIALGFTVILWPSRRRRLPYRLCALLLLGIGLMTVTGCAPAPQNASPYTGTVTITASDATGATQTTPITLTIQ